MQSIRLFVTDRQLAAVLTVSPADRGDVQGSKSARTPNPILGRAIWPPELRMLRLAQHAPELGIRHRMLEKTAMKRVETTRKAYGTGSIPAPHLCISDQNATHIASIYHANSTNSPPGNRGPDCADVRAKDKLWLKRCLSTPPTRKKPALLWLMETK